MKKEKKGKTFYQINVILFLINIILLSAILLAKYQTRKEYEKILEIKEYLDKNYEFWYNENKENKNTKET